MTAETRVGTVIEDKYRLDEQIGRGSMGAVYRGTQLMVDRSVAVKLLHPTYAGHEKIQARFEVEAKAIARLNHPNCITLFDFGYSEDMEAFYTVVEYIDGLSLEKLVDKRPPIARVVGVVKQIASALGHAHHHGILHRDLKPENIMLATMTDGSEMVKVLDFGIAQIMKGNSDDEDGDDGTNEFESDRLTRVGEVFGTPPYMSPEQAHSAHDLSPATDLYSLGVIFYELLEGRLPFFADNPVDIMTMHINDPPPPMKRADVPKSVKSVVLQMLAKDPADRPESGDKIVTLLDAIPDEDLSEESRPIAAAAGDARSTEPTLLEDPPDTDTLTDSAKRADTDIDLSGADGPAPGEASELYELSDLVDPPLDNSPPAQASKPPPGAKPATGPDKPSRDDFDPQSIKATILVDDSLPDDDDPDLASAASNINKQQRRMVIGVVIAVLLVGAALVWIISEYQLISWADEETTGGAAQLAEEMRRSSTSSNPRQDDDEDKILAQDESEVDEFDDDGIDDDELDEDSPQEVRDDEDGDEEEGSDDGDDTDEEEATADAEPPAAAPSPSPPPRPQPPPAAADPAPDDEDEQEEARPQRLDLDL